MTIEKILPNGQSSTVPIISGLKPTSPSYTFSDSRGLLYSTQFAQPALMIMEMAAYEDVRARGLVQKSASFAGHSLGEYSALGALGSVIPMESLVSLVFYRGLTMQVAMARDENGKTEFSMVAANPSRVNKGNHSQSIQLWI
jgi:fatty acid synthase subunit beta, fungi type